MFLALWRRGLTEYDTLKGIDWSWLAAVGAITKAPLGGKTSGRNPTDRGKQSTKRSVLTEASGIPIRLVVAGANRHDVMLLAPTLESIVVRRPRPTQRRPQGLCLDKAYDVTWMYRLLTEAGFTPHVRSRREEVVQRTQGHRARRWVVERTHSWMNASAGCWSAGRIGRSTIWARCTSRARTSPSRALAYWDSL